MRNVGACLECKRRSLRKDGCGPSGMVRGWLHGLHASGEYEAASEVKILHIIAKAFDFIEPLFDLAMYVFFVMLGFAIAQVLHTLIIGFHE